MVEPTQTEMFSKRLNALLDAAGAPGLNSGRVQWLHKFVKKKLDFTVSYEACRKWVVGESMPYTKRISAIARGLGGTTEYLLGETNDNAPQHESKGVGETKGMYKATKGNAQFLSMLDQLDEKSRHQLSIYMQGLLAGQGSRDELDAKTPHSLPAINTAKPQTKREEK